MPRKAMSSRACSQSATQLKGLSYRNKRRFALKKKYTKMYGDPKDYYYRKRVLHITNWQHITLLFSYTSLHKKGAPAILTRPISLSKGALILVMSQSLRRGGRPLHIQASLIIHAHLVYEHHTFLTCLLRTSVINTVHLFTIF